MLEKTCANSGFKADLIEKECLCCRLSAFDPQSRVIECLKQQNGQLVSIIDFHEEFIGSPVELKEFKKSFTFLLDKYTVDIAHNEAVEFRAVKLNLDMEELEKAEISNNLDKNYFNMISRLTFNGKTIQNIVGTHHKIKGNNQVKFLEEPLVLSNLRDELQEFQITQ